VTKLTLDNRKRVFCIDLAVSAQVSADFATRRLRIFT
jgi:hypothetical protein